MQCDREMYADEIQRSLTPAGLDYDYGELVATMPGYVLHSFDVGDYQGDTFYLLKDGTRYGVLVFGYGSCSGCDALQGCESDVQRVTELRNDMYNSIVWRESAEMMRDYLNTRDWSLEWYGNMNDWNEGVKQAIQAMVDTA